VTDADAVRGRILVEESPEIVAVLDAAGRVLHCSRRARVEGVEIGQPMPERLARVESVVVPYEVAGGRESLVYVGTPGALAAYEELRSGFTAAVSHELRTPLARLLVLLESAGLPGMDVDSLLEQARAEVGQVSELIDEVLFLSQLETGQEIVGLGGAATYPLLQEVVAELADRAERAGVAMRAEGDPSVELPLRPRMQRVIVENLALNAIRYAGEGARFVLSVRREPGAVVLSGSDDGIGVDEGDLPRLFERFYRADRARSSRGTGLGLAIVKHIVVAAGGRVEATGGEGRGLTVRCVFPA
jgi:two-component system phosphate regulon sensor histidine kinase PhoR